MVHFLLFAPKSQEMISLKKKIFFNFPVLNV